MAVHDSPVIVGSVRRRLSAERVVKPTIEQYVDGYLVARDNAGADRSRSTSSFSAGFLRCFGRNYLAQLLAVAPADRDGANPTAVRLALENAAFAIHTRPYCRGLATSHAFDFVATE